MFRAMHNNKKNSKSRTPSVEETNARLDKEFAQQNSQGQDLPPKEGESKVLDETMQTSSVTTDKAEEIVPDVSSLGSDQRPLREIPGQLSLPTVTRLPSTQKGFLRNFLATLKRETKNHPYSWMISGS